jgi:GTP-binding protein
MLETWEELPPIFVSSSVNTKGREEILDYISAINAELL